jgi:putative transposase
LAHTFTHLLTHIIFSTKDRRPLLAPEIRDQLYPYLGGIFRELGATLLDRNATDNHIHLLVSLPQDKALSDIMRTIKTNSSRWIHETFNQHQSFSWQIGYGAFSVSESSRQEVIKYIAAQEEHHRTITFEEEFVTFLKKHHIQYDPKYIWE